MKCVHRSQKTAPKTIDFFQKKNMRTPIVCSAIPLRLQKEIKLNDLAISCLLEQLQIVAIILTANSKCTLLWKLKTKSFLSATSGESTTQ